MKKFRVKKTTYLLRDSNDGDIVYVLVAKDCRNYSFVIENCLFLSQYLIAFRNPKEIDDFMSITESDPGNYQVIKIQVFSDSTSLLSIETETDFEHVSLDLSAKEYLEDNEWRHIEIETHIQTESLYDFFAGIESKKEQYQSEAKEQIKKEIQLTQQVQNELDVGFNKSEEVSTDFPTFDDFDKSKLKYYSITELNAFLDLASIAEAYDEAALIRDEIAKR